MSLPSPGDYQEEIQDPKFCFRDSDLRAGQPELDSFDIPKPISGNFASVYKLKSGNKQWAVKCFTRQVSDQAFRYNSISQHLIKNQLPYTIAFDFQNEGIKVKNRWFPILKMEWVPGELLRTYVERNLNSPQRLINLANRWLQMLNILNGAQVAHGDLQHGNVVVVNDDFKLIDYDDMYVPSLVNFKSNAVGNEHYQHPQRREHHFNLAMDNFSAWVIYLTLCSLSVNPNIWTEVKSDSDFILFHKSDYINPDRSKLFNLLSNSTDNKIRQLASYFKTFLKMEVDNIPTIQQYLNQHYIIEPSVSLPEWLIDHLPDRPNINKTKQTLDTQPDLEIEPILAKLSLLRENDKVVRDLSDSLVELNLPDLTYPDWVTNSIVLPQRSYSYNTISLAPDLLTINATFRQSRVNNARLLSYSVLALSIFAVFMNQLILLISSILLIFPFIYYLKVSFNKLNLKEYLNNLQDSHNLQEQTLIQIRANATQYRSFIDDFDNQLKTKQDLLLTEIKNGQEQLQLITKPLSEVEQITKSIKEATEITAKILTSNFYKTRDNVHQLKEMYAQMFKDEDKEKML